MKNIIYILLALTICSTSIATNVENKPVVYRDKSIGYNMVRGWGNLITSPFEIFRGIVYYNDKFPLIGTFPGVIVGPLNTVKRTLLGVSDILTFGLYGDVLYETFSTKDFVWKEDWIVVNSK